MFAAKLNGCCIVPASVQYVNQHPPLLLQCGDSWRVTYQYTAEVVAVEAAAAAAAAAQGRCSHLQF
jgi:hypothetical protein